MYDRILIRFGEMTLKKDNYKYFLDRIIRDIEKNGGLDLNRIHYLARLVHCHPFEIVYDYAKLYYNCHGNTARAVAKHYI